MNIALLLFIFSSPLMQKSARDVDSAVYFSGEADQRRDVRSALGDLTLVFLALGVGPPTLLYCMPLLWCG